MPVVSDNNPVQEILGRVEKAFNSSERKNAETQWDELSKYLMPSASGTFNVDVANKGGKKTTDIYDNTGIQANSDLASTFHSTLTNPATRWSNMEFDSAELNNDDEARTWLEDSRDRMHKALNQSNFDVEVASNYQLFTALGTMSLQHEALPLNLDGSFGGFFFKAWHLSNIAYEENQYGKVDTIYRKFKWTKKQAEERWGNKIPKKIEESNDYNQEFEFVHVIRPNAKFNPNDANAISLPVKKMPWESLYIYKDEQEVVERGGYMEFPNHVTRWSLTPGEKYGRGPGHIAIPDVRTLNKMVELGLTAIARGIAPPIFTERRNILGSLALKPNGLTTVADINKIKEFNTNARSDLYQFTKEDYKNSIRQAFFLDKLLLPPREEVGEMTAFEVARRIEQTQRVLGPTFGRLNQDFLQPFVIRCFKMMMRAGAFAEPPRAVAELGLNIQIKFVNALARSQQIEEVTAIQQWTQILGGLAQLEQFETEATDLLDVDKAGETAARILGVPEDSIRDQKDRDARRTKRDEEREAALQSQLNLQAADAQSKVGA
jgi:hypothetical protein